MSTELSRPGKFYTHRDLTGAAASDSTTINDTNFPVTGGFNCSGCESIWVYWTGTGGDVSADRLLFVPLMRDGINGVWTKTAEVGVLMNTLQEITTHGANLVYLRISGEETTATNIKVRVAKAEASYEKSL